jgi:hypothetical protein
MRFAELFPDGDFRFHLTLRRADPREFFGPRDPTGRLVAERARWIAAEPARYAVIAPEGEAALREFAAMAKGWVPRLEDAASMSSPSGLLHRLGGSLEPDILFLTAGSDGPFRLRGGALCFPTGWALVEKLGHTMEFIHDVVPGLNSAIGPAINQFLSKLKPGVAFLRDNWGIAATDELNLHPARGLPPPEPPVALDRLWLRVEHQALLALPESGGIVFGIRIVLHRLDGIVGQPEGGGLRRALATMPHELIRYKRLERIHADLLNVLQ